jgi:hypothetical protein
MKIMKLKKFMVCEFNGHHIIWELIIHKMAPSIPTSLQNFLMGTVNGNVTFNIYSQPIKRRRQSDEDNSKSDNIIVNVII